MTKPKVLVTRRWPQSVEERMAEVFDLDLNMADKPLSQADLRDAMGRYDAILPTVTDRLPSVVFEAPSPRTNVTGKRA